LPFLGIAQLDEAVLNTLPAGPEGSLADVLAADAEARRIARKMIRDRKFA
jgi:1-deoxy-D-xylulose-5-phosphate reductoisomerase